MPGPALRRLRRAAIAATLLIAVVLLPVLPAEAHTALLGSDPVSGAELAYSPDQITLRFATAVDPRTVDAVLRASDGSVVASTLANDPEVPSAIIVVEVPRLPHGVFGLSWQSVGADGHRVTGEVLFGVGVSAESAAVAGGGAPATALLLDQAAVAGRVVWYLALALLAGVAVLGGAVRVRRDGVDVAPSGLRAAALGLLPTALWLGVAGALLRGLAAALTRLDIGADPAAAVVTRATAGWSAAGLLLALLTSNAGRRATRLLVPTRGGIMPASAAVAAVALLGAVLLGTLAGHAPSRPDPVVAVLFAIVHVGAAALWTGPLLALLLSMRTPAWRGAGEAQRRADLRQAVVPVTRVAGWALAAVAASGGLLAVRALDGVSSEFVVALVAKGVIVAGVAVPLGIWHHRTHRRWDAAPRTLRVEAAGLVLAVALGGVLVGWDPGWRSPGSADPALAAVFDGSATDPQACTRLDVGKAACLRASLEGLLVSEGPEAAIAALTALSTTDDYVIGNCHQVAHDLGNDASERIDDMAEALSVEASLCWSGYYHGFVEARLADISDEELAAALPAFCATAAAVPYSFTHYNCLHGLGHGLMLRYDADLFGVLPLCATTGDTWEQRSCSSGAFMENVIAAQQGLEVPAFDDTDLLYPCTAIEGPILEDCYLMQTSYVLWRLGGDIEGGFAWCNTLEVGDRQTCYRSMGRDISAGAGLDPTLIVRRCGLGQPEVAQWCIDGAASNAVYEQAGRGAADALCAAVRPEWVAACTASRDTALGIVAAG